MNVRTTIAWSAVGALLALSGCKNNNTETTTPEPATEDMEDAAEETVEDAEDAAEDAAEETEEAADEVEDEID